MVGERPEEVLGAKALPELHRGEWPFIIEELTEMGDESAGGAAILWYADALAFLHHGEIAGVRPRPWAWAFERAMARGGHTDDAERMINDWVADELWMMRWLAWDCTFDVARAELATRVAMVRHMIDRLARRKVNRAQAAAEAIMVVELGATYDQWTDLVGAIANEPSPASWLE
jgi:hypothetical protein